MKLKLRLNHWLLTMSLITITLTPACGQTVEDKYPFPELGYAYDALEPAFDAKTMELHYSKHHKGYYTKFLKAVTESQMESLSIEEILSKANTLTPFMRNNAGGYYNHSIFWKNLSANPSKEIPSKLEEALIESFGSVDAFKDEFTKQASSVFGSGWAWLVLSADGKLMVSSTPNQDNPLMNDVAIKGTPLLALDVWEHAYYLKYQNKRASYIDAFWDIVDWNEVARRLEAK